VRQAARHWLSPLPFFFSQEGFLASAMAAAMMASAKVAMPAFSGLKASSKASDVKVLAAPCVCPNCKSRTVRASANQGEATFASVSQSAAPSPAAPSVVPAILGAGALGAAAYFVVKKIVAPNSPAPSAPSSSYAPSTTPYTIVPPYIPRAKSAAPAALATMAGTFPNAIQEEAFIKAVAAELSNLGFKRDNCIALINTCRDEVCRPLVQLVDREFGLSFNISGLGGLVNCGKTGFVAAMSHSPIFPCDVDGTAKERYIFMAFPHVSVGETGEVGSLLRRGRGKPSNACGALIAIKNDITSGAPVVEDPDNAEYILLKKKVMSKIDKSVSAPTLVQTTKAALAAIDDDLEKLISLTVDPSKADYAVITGVQIHSGNQIPGEPFRVERTCDYIAPDKMYAVVRGQRYNLQIEAKKAETVAA
jgi:hypothetical protein